MQNMTCREREAACEFVNGSLTNFASLPSSPLLFFLFFLFRSSRSHDQAHGHVQDAQVHAECDARAGHHMVTTEAAQIEPFDACTARAEDTQACASVRSLDCCFVSVCMCLSARAGFLSTAMLTALFCLRTTAVSCSSAALSSNLRTSATTTNKSADALIPPLRHTALPPLPRVRPSHTLPPFSSASARHSFYLPSHLARHFVTLLLLSPARPLAVRASFIRPNRVRRAALSCWLPIVASKNTHTYSQPCISSNHSQHRIVNNACRAHASLEAGKGLQMR